MKTKSPSVEKKYKEALLRQMILDLSPHNFDGLKNKLIANVKQDYYYIQLLKLLANV